MEQLNMNVILNREMEEKMLKMKLIELEKNKHRIDISRGFYVYGYPGTGKTEFVKRVLNDLDYSTIVYDAGDIRNKAIINTITKHNMSDRSVFAMLHKRTKRVAIIMDEIDGMNNGDKGGITSLIKLIRAKKTKKQKKEDVTMIPIICIGSMQSDKKIKELMKVCSVIMLHTPSTEQIQNILESVMPKLEYTLQTQLVNFIGGDLRKLISAFNIYKKQQHLLKTELIKTIFKPKIDNEDTKSIAKYLINQYVPFKKHTEIINETDRTSVSLLFHENIIDVLMTHKNPKTIPFYLDMLNSICYADYIDRITFQKQLWIFNEISSLMKTIHTNNMYHKLFDHEDTYQPTNVRFTKVLTKYSTEYNNTIFIHKLCEELHMDKSDMLSYFLHLRNTDVSLPDILKQFETLDINKLDINRIYRYIDNHTVETEV